MASPPPTVFKQDLPPAGGYAKPPGFPAEGCVLRAPALRASRLLPSSTSRLAFPPRVVGARFRKRSPARGPAGAIIGAGALALMAWGWYRLVGSVEERNYYNLARFNARFERGAFVARRQRGRSRARARSCVCAPAPFLPAATSGPSLHLPPPQRTSSRLPRTRAGCGATRRRSTASAR